MHTLSQSEITAAVIERMMSSMLYNILKVRLAQSDLTQSILKGNEQATRIAREDLDPDQAIELGALTTALLAFKCGCPHHFRVGLLILSAISLRAENFAQENLYDLTPMAITYAAKVHKSANQQDDVKKLLDMLEGDDDDDE